jgi:pyruvate/2-oxoglutarate dehydrogenase complex dihydrolipoamide acyltransferase (E2) component
MGAVEVRLPQMSMGMSEAEVMTWHVAVGDSVEAEQDLVEIAGEKVSITIPAPVAGVVVRIAVEAGGFLPVNDVLCVIEAGSR